MKKLILASLIMAIGLSLYAQDKYTVIKSNLPEKSWLTPLVGKYGMDFIYIQDTDKPKHGNSNDVILCFDKQGKPIREISVVHPKMEFLGVFEGSDALKVVFHKEERKTDSVIIASVNKDQDNYSWAPQAVSGCRSKEVDETIFKVSPDGKKFLICRYLGSKKKKKLDIDIMVFNENGSLDYTKQFESSYDEKHRNKGLRSYVANDGAVYVSYTTYRSDLSNEDRYTYLYYINRDELLSHKFEEFFPYQGVVTHRGDFMILKTSKDHSWVLGFNMAKKEFFYDESSMPEGMVDNSWMNSVCSIKGRPYITGTFTYPIGDASATMMCEWAKNERDAVPETKTSTYKDKNGNTRTQTSTEYKVVLSIDFRGNITSVSYNMEEETFVHDTIFKRQRRSLNHAYNLERFDQLSYRAFQQGNEVRVYYVDSDENYKDDGTEGLFGRFTFRQDNPCWATATLGPDGMFSPRKMVAKFTDEFVLNKVLIGYDNYWIIKVDSDSKKQYNIATLRY